MKKTIALAVFILAFAALAQFMVAAYSQRVEPMFGGLITFGATVFAALIESSLE